MSLVAKIRCQQDAVYRAEASFMPRGRHLADEDALQRYVDDLRDLPWWEANCPGLERIDAQVLPTSKHGSVGTLVDGFGFIEMSPMHMTGLFVLHEVAHVVAAVRYGSTSHDPWFARTFLELLSLVEPQCYMPLYLAFKKEGVDFEVQASGGGIAL